jgi:peptidoglycan/LPS O-acetylase OafA/YrhL
VPPALQVIPWGSWGVQLFFVLSGYLITGILLRARQAAEDIGGSRRLAVRQFYVRRALRILPLYYLVIAVAFALNLGETRRIIGPLLTHILNVYMADQHAVDEHFAHFWSLNVEEHFYLVWPWLVLFSPRRGLLALAVVAVILGPWYRVYAYDTGGHVAGYVLTPGSLDFLGIGALLALTAGAMGAKARLRRFLLWLALLASLVLIGVSWLRPFGMSWEANEITSGYGAALLFCFLVERARRGIGGTVGALLEAAPLRYVGKISYGVYVYHLFMPALLAFVVGSVGIAYAPGALDGFLVLSGLTVIVASISWYALERPLNGLKRFFPTEPRRLGSQPSRQAGPVRLSSEASAAD